MYYVSFYPVSENVKTPIMALKWKFDASVDNVSKKRKTITMEEKVDIKHSEWGETPANISRVLGYSKSTIGTILIDKSMWWVMWKLMPHWM